MQIKQPLPGSFENSMRQAFIAGLFAVPKLRNTTTSAVARALGTTAGITNWHKYDQAVAQMGATPDARRRWLDEVTALFAEAHRIRLEPMPFRGDSERKAKRLEAQGA